MSAFKTATRLPRSKMFMEIGYRIIRPEDIGLHPLRFAQISLWRSANWGIADGERAVRDALEIAAECKRRGISTVFHPIDYFLSREGAERSLDVLRRLAEASDLGVIIHDEGRPDGQRLSPEEQSSYERRLLELSACCPLSVENAFNSRDCLWFWERFVAPADSRVSITLDIGHLESAGMDSITFVREMPERLVKRIRFVHMHHKAAERYGLMDHWPLVAGCREIEALKALLARKRDLRVILELEAREKGVKDSIALLQGL